MVHANSISPPFTRLNSKPHKAESLGHDNRKTMIKVKTIGQILPFKSGTALPSPSQAPGWAIVITQSPIIVLAAPRGHSVVT